VVAGLCKRVIVMYAGEIVEEGTAEQIFESPQHPYTWSLLRSLPRIDANRRERLRSIEGLPPDLIALPPGCKFSPRCPFRIERCFSDAPKLAAANGHVAACHVTMARAYAEMGAQDIIDTRPGAASGVHPPGYALPAENEPFLEAPAGEAGELVGPGD
jgi:oligopeptide/dipeptide ABC transporter ATP-binding protein